MLGKIEGRRRRGQQRIRWLDGIAYSMGGHEFEQSLGDCEGQGSLVCCSLWGCKELDETEQLNDNNQDSCLKNPMHRGVWWATVCRVAELDMTE